MEYIIAEGVGDQHEALIAQMTDVLSHRGPDDSGVHREDKCVLGHRRLSIIDLSSNGHQPFVSDDNRYLMTYNGEIYNYIELREELKALGVSFKTETDTEVLLKAYQHWGVDCLSRLNGMFAFVIYDTKDKELFIVRDRVGIKPLYYTNHDGSFYFSSETKALTALPRSCSVNNQVLFDLLVFNRTDVFEDTLFSEIKRLPKGHYAIINSKGMSIKQWWNPFNYVSENSDISIDELSNQIEETMVSAVTLRMRSDVRVGCCLSGGLDSSILLGILFQKELAGKGYPTFTASFPDHPID